jgi:NtrC-family two-component system response regulator AlgB
MEPKKRALVIDDETGFTRMLSLYLEKAGYEVIAADSGERGLEVALTKSPDIVLVDLRLPGMDGIAVVKELVQRLPAVPTIMITAYATIDNTVEAMKAGAADYLVKPFTPQQIVQVMEQALARAAQRCEATAGARGAGRELRANVKTRSPAMQAALMLAHRAAKTDATLLLLGETGTGKSRLARYIHDLSPRAAAPFIAVHCAAIAPSLVESQLFGHCKGSFSGADRVQPGFVEAAGAGTLFLDDVGELPLEIQGKLLRLLEEREYVRVGDNVARTSEARIMAATHRDLKAAVQNGSFREDLYYRLNVLSLRIPSLRERRVDIPGLAYGMVEDLVQRYQRHPVAISPAAERELIAYSWPGNLRELVNVLERAVILATGDTLTPEQLPEEVRAVASDSPAAQDVSETLDAAERRHLIAVLARHPTLESAAKALGIDPSTLYRKRHRYGLL